MTPRSRRTIPLLLALLLAVVALGWRLRAPELLTRIALSVSSHAGVDARALPVRSFDGNQLRIGESIVCRTVSSLPLCVHFSGAEITFGLSLQRMPVRVESIRIFDPAVVLEPGAPGEPQAGPNFPALSLPLQFDGIPQLTLEHSESGPPLPAEGWFVTGSLQTSPKEVRLALHLADHQGRAIDLSGESSPDHPLSLTVMSGNVPVLDLALSDQSATTGDLTISRLAPLDAVFPDLIPSWPPLLEARLSAHWKAAGAKVISNFQVIAPGPISLPGFQDLRSVKLRGNISIDPHFGTVPTLTISGASLAWTSSSTQSHTLDADGLIALSSAATAQLRLAHRESGFVADLSASCVAGCRAGSLRAVAQSNGPQNDLSRLPTTVPLPFQLTQGTLNATAALRWGTPDMSPAVDLEASAAVLASSYATIRGLTGVFHLLPARKTRSTLNAESIETAITLSRPTVTLETSEHGKDFVVSLLQSQAELLGGTIGVTDGTLKRGEASATVRFCGIGLGALLALYKQSYIEADGLVAGELPIVFSGGEFAVRGGHILSEGGGSIRYLGTSGGAAPAGSLSFAEQALQDYQYHTLSAEIGYEPAGDLNIEAHLTGTSPALNIQRPINVNLSLQENLRDLLHSLRIADDIEHEVGKLW